MQDVLLQEQSSDLTPFPQVQDVLLQAQSSDLTPILQVQDVLLQEQISDLTPVPQVQDVLLQDCTVISYDKRVTEARESKGNRWNSLVIKGSHTLGLAMRTKASEADLPYKLPVSRSLLSRAELG